MAILRNVRQNEIAKESPHVEAHGAVEAELRVNAFGGVLGNHDGSCVQISMQQCLRSLTKPVTQPCLQISMKDHKENAEIEIWGVDMKEIMMGACLYLL